MSRTDRFWKPCFSVVALALLLLSGKVLYGQGQQTAATLSGSVTDPQGGAVSGAKLTLTSEELGIPRTYSTGVDVSTLLRSCPRLSTRCKWRPRGSGSTYKKESLWPPARLPHRMLA
jgi:hypothetical protein